MIIQDISQTGAMRKAMTAYMKLNGIRILIIPPVSFSPHTEQVRQNAEKDCSRKMEWKLEFIRKLHAFRKDDRIQNIIAETGKRKVDPYLFSAMECCITHRPWHDKINLGRPLS